MAIQNPGQVLTSSKVVAPTGGQVGEELPLKLARLIAYQNSAWSVSRLAGCKIVRHKGSDFRDCKAELEVYNSDGRMVLRGREFNSSPTCFWTL